MDFELSIREALRYLGAPQGDEALRRDAEEAARQAKAAAAPRYVYRVFSLEHKNEGAYLPEADLLLPGALVRAMLAGSSRAVLLACTLGAEFDRALAAAQARDMARAVLLDACGSAYAEGVCQGAEKEISGRFPDAYLTDRFSPGYGDFPLTAQRALAEALNGEKALGIHVTPACMLSPSKSVTAVIGLSPQPQPARIRGCPHCALKNNCSYRERGVTCAV